MAQDDDTAADGLDDAFRDAVAAELKALADAPPVVGTAAPEPIRVQRFDDLALCVRDCRHYAEVRTAEGFADGSNLLGTASRKCLVGATALPTDLDVGDRTKQIQIPVTCTQYDPWSDDEIDNRSRRRHQADARHKEEADAGAS